MNILPFLSESTENISHVILFTICHLFVSQKGTINYYESFAILKLTSGQPK
jgi:hypothetical protein